MDASVGFLENTELPDLPVKSTISSSDNGRVTTHSSNVLILAPFTYEQQGLRNADNTDTILPPGTSTFSCRVYSELEKKLRDAGYEVKSIVTTDQDIEITSTPVPDNFLPETPSNIWITNIKDGKQDSFVRPDDFKNLNNYGVIYISTHGVGLTNEDPNSYGVPEPWDSMVCGPYCQNDWDLSLWVGANRKIGSYYKYIALDPNDPNSAGTGMWKDGWWSVVYWHKKTYTIGGQQVEVAFRFIRLTRKFFELNASNVTNSIIYISSCYSGDLKYIFTGPEKNNVYLCYNKRSFQQWSDLLAYYYFHYLMYGFTEPEEIPGYTPTGEEPSSPPMSAREAYNVLSGDSPTYNKVKVNPDPFDYPDNPGDPNDPVKFFKGCWLEIEGDPNSDTYFPVPATVIVSEE